MRKFIVGFIYLFCAFVLLEITFNYVSFNFLYPIKNATSYGYISKKNSEIIIPLNKYSTRFQSQLALPFEYTIATYNNNKQLSKTLDNETKLYGFKNNKGKLEINHNYIEAQNFESDNAIVAIDVNGAKKYGTINKQGEWVIQPIYAHLCSFNDYYAKACIDKNHCGIIDKLGSEVVKMSCAIGKICKTNECISEICTIGKNYKKS